MLERIGCVDVSVEVLDYNMLQFEELSSEHIECLATLIEDPTQSDVLLGIGARPARPATSDAVFALESRGVFVASRSPVHRPGLRTLLS